MGYIHCCGALRKSKSFKLAPQGDYLICEMDYLEECPVCGHRVLQLTRMDYRNKLSSYRVNNAKALKLYDKLKSQIIYRRTCKIPRQGSKFYLNYNEYGIKKKCYSNLSTLKLGLFENSY